MGRPPEEEGYAAIGVLIVEDGVQEQIGLPLEDRMDNHRAEFEALLYGLRHLKAKNKHGQLVFCYTDSKLVAESIRKKYTKKAEHKLLLEEALRELPAFTIFTWNGFRKRKTKGPIISPKKRSISSPKRENDDMFFLQKHGKHFIKQKRLSPISY